MVEYRRPRSIKEVRNCQGSEQYVVYRGGLIRLKDLRELVRASTGHLMVTDAGNVEG